MGLALKLATIIEARLPLLKLQNKQIFENFIKMLRNNSSSEIPIISSPKVLPLMIDYIEAENEYQVLILFFPNLFPSSLILGFKKELCSVA